MDSAVALSGPDRCTIFQSISISWVLRDYHNVRENRSLHNENAHSGRPSIYVIITASNQFYLEAFKNITHLLPTIFDSISIEPGSEKSYCSCEEKCQISRRKSKFEIYFSFDQDPDIEIFCCIHLDL